MVQRSFKRLVFLTYTYKCIAKAKIDHKAEFKKWKKNQEKWWTIFNKTAKKDKHEINEHFYQSLLRFFLTSEVSSTTHAKSLSNCFCFKILISCISKFVSLIRNHNKNIISIYSTHNVVWLNRLLKIHLRIFHCLHNLN